MKTNTKTLVIVFSVIGGLLVVCVVALCIWGFIRGGPPKEAQGSSTPPVVVATTQAAPVVVATTQPAPAGTTAAPKPSATTPAAPKKYSESAKFPTGRYADEVRVTIDNLHAAKDCKGLQGEFDKAAANDQAQRDRTGSGTADLMTYIDGAMKSASCH